MKYNVLSIFTHETMEHIKEVVNKTHHDTIDVLV